MNPLERYLQTENLLLPKQGSWPQSWHQFNEDSAYALAAAEAAQRPLLIRGEPGTGKSQLARAAAVATQRLFLAQVIHATTVATDLQWQFDAVARLGEAQTLAQVERQSMAELLAPRRFLTPGSLWWAFDWQSAHQQWQHCAQPLSAIPEQPHGWQSEHGCVILIDEIDKADNDLPNSLLETLGNGDFAVPYLEHSVRQQPHTPLPLVIITTNEERELPAAFLRRCLVLQLSLPDDDQELMKLLIERGTMHFGAEDQPHPCNSSVCKAAAEQLCQDRRRARELHQPPPGQAEYLDLLRAVCGLAQDNDQRLHLLERVQHYVLKKQPEHPY